MDKVPKHSIEAKLYKIIDNIDTARDVYKSDHEGFEKYVAKMIKEAHRYIHSPDGYTIVYMSNTIKQDPIEKMSDADLLKWLIDRNGVSVASKTTRRHGKWYEVVIGIDDNNCAFITLPDDSLDALKNKINTNIQEEK